MPKGKIIMKSISIVAVVAVLSFGTAAFAQVAVNAGGGAGGDVSATGSGTSVGAGTSTDVSAGVSTGDSSAASSALSSASSAVSSGLSSVSSEMSSGLSSASSELSSGLSSLSSEANSALSSESASASASANCDNVDASAVLTAPLSQAALGDVTSVQVFSISDCSGLSGLRVMDTTASANLAGDVRVAAALQAAGESGGEIVGYLIDGTTLVVYVKQ